MRSSTRIRTADRLAEEIVDYVFRTFAPALFREDKIWEEVAPADRAMMRAIGEWEEGRLTYAELEAEGARYVEAWERVAGAYRAEVVRVA